MGWIKNTIKEKMKRAEEQAFREGGYISYDPYTGAEVEAVVAQSNLTSQMAELYKRDPKAYAELMKNDLMRNAMIGIGNSGLGGLSAPFPPYPTAQAQPQHSAIEKIAMRMRWPSNYHVP